MWKDDRFFTGKHKALTAHMAAALLKKGRVKVSGLFSEKKASPMTLWWCWRIPASM